MKNETENFLKSWSKDILERKPSMVGKFLLDRSTRKVFKVTDYCLEVPMRLDGTKCEREELYLELTQVAGDGHTTKITGDSYLWMFASDVIVYYEILPDSAEALYGNQKKK